MPGLCLASLVIHLPAPNTVPETWRVSNGGKDAAMAVQGTEGPARAPSSWELVPCLPDTSRRGPEVSLELSLPLCSQATQCVGCWAPWQPGLGLAWGTRAG